MFPIRLTSNLGLLLLFAALTFPVSRDLAAQSVTASDEQESAQAPSLDEIELARWNGGSLSAGDALAFLQRARSRYTSLVEEWANVDQAQLEPSAVKGLRKEIEDVVMQLLLIPGAEADGEAEAPEIAYRLHRSRSRLLANRFAEELRAERPEPTEEELLGFWERRRGDHQVRPKLHVSYLFRLPGETEEDDAKTRELMEELRERALGGEDFAELCREYSEGTNAEQGGEVAPIEVGKGNPEFEALAIKLATGEISEVIDANNGFYIFKMINNDPGREVTLDEVRAEIHDRYLYATWNDYMAAVIEPWKEEAGLRIEMPFGDSPNELIVLEVSDWKLSWGELKEWEKVSPHRIMPTLEQWGLEEAIRLHQEKSGYTDDPAVALMLERNRKVVLGAYRLDQVIEHELDVSEEAMRAHYEAHPERFQSPHRKRITMAVVAPGTPDDPEDSVATVRRRHEARRLAAEFDALIQAGIDFDTAAEQLAPTAAYPDMIQVLDQGEVARLPMTSAIVWHSLSEVGARSGMLQQMDGTWRMLRCDALIEPELLPFEQASRSIQQDLVREQAAAARATLRERLFESNGVELLIPEFEPEQANDADAESSQ